MKITLSQRLKPFSFCKGGEITLPGSFVTLKIFPTKVEIFPLGGEEKKLFFALQGPFPLFFYQSNIEKRRIEVFFRNDRGFFSYHLFLRKGKFSFFLARGDFLVLEEKGIKSELRKKQTLSWDLTPVESSNNFCEKIAFGCHKKQEIEKVLLRKDPKEFFPFWFRLGNLCPRLGKEKSPFFSDMEKAFLRKDPTFLVKRLSLLLEVAFSGFFVPSLQDKTEQNLPFPSGDLAHPYLLLQEGAFWIKHLFLQEEKEGLALLKNLPKELPFGRAKGLICFLGKIDLEWSKKKIKKAILYPEKTGHFRLFLKPCFQRFRLRRRKKEKGVFVRADSFFSIEKGNTLYLDRFEK